MKQLAVINADYIGGLSLKLDFSNGMSRNVDFSDFLEKHPHPQYNKYGIISNFKKFTLRNGNVIWGKHADLCFPIDALYAGNLELTCDMC